MRSSCPALSGSAQITIKNISNSSISGTLQFAVKERHIKHAWQNFDDVEFCNRGMIPNADGESVTIAAGESITKERVFTLKSDWVKNNCRVVAFLQKSDKEIVEGCAIGVNEGTPILVTEQSTKQSIRLQQRARDLLVYSPYKGVHIISVMNLAGRVLMQSSHRNNGEVIVVPSTVGVGLIVVTIESPVNTSTRRITVSSGG